MHACSFWRPNCLFVIETIEIFMNLSNLTKILSLVGALGALSSVYATPVIYTNSGAFGLAAGATNLIDFEAQNPNAFYQGYGNSLTVGSVTFTDNASTLYVLSDAVYGTQHGSSYLNNNSVGTLVGMNFANPVYAVGMEIGYLFPWGGGNSVTINLSSGSSYNLGLNQLYNSGVNNMQFWGFTSDVSISSVTFNDYTGGLALDNVQYSTTSNSVPDGSATGLMLFGGLVALAGIRSKRNR